MIYVIGLLGFAVAFLLPGHYFPWTSVQQETAAAVGALLCGLGVAVTSKDWPIRAPMSASILAVVSLVPLAQWLTGAIPYHADALLAMVYLVASALTIMTARQLYVMHGERFVYLTFVAVLIAAVASVGIGLAQWLGIGHDLPFELISRGERVSANLRQPNQLASLLGIGLVGVVWLYEQRRIGAVVGALAGAFLAFGLLLTQSRTPWIFVILIGALWFARRGRVPFRLSGAVVVASLLVFATGVIGWDRLTDVVQSGVSAQDLSQRAQTGTRLVIWTVMWDAALHTPPMGYGWLQIPAAQVSVALDNPPVWYWLSSSHNLLLDIVLWNGWIIATPLLGGVVWWVIARIRNCRSIDSWASLAVLSVLAAHSMVELPLHYAYFLLVAALFVGIVEGGTPGIGRPRIVVGRIVYSAALAVLSGVLFLIGREYLDVEEQVRRARLKDAGYVAGGSAPAVPDVVILDGLREYVHIWLIDAREGMPSADMDRMRKAIARYPVPPALFKYALAAALNGRGPEAERTLAVLCRTAMPDNCRNGRETWARLAKHYPQVAKIPFPATPTR